jgi:hypothetical protein
MITKKVFMYYCEFCKKPSGNKHWAIIHELHCTMNPDRTCRMCTVLGLSQRPMRELLSMLPVVIVDPSDYYNGSLDDLSLAVDKMRHNVKCPACIFAALRQSRLIGFTNFDYRVEREAVLQGER